MNLKEYNERLGIWMARATAHLDTKEIRAQAKAMFEEKMGKPLVEESLQTKRDIGL